MKSTYRNSFLILLCCLFISFKINSQSNTYSDTFATQDYNRNDGTANWSTDWIEANDGTAANDPDGGNIFIFLGNGGELAFVEGVNQSIERTVDLSGNVNAILSFNWRANQLDSFIFKIFIFL